MDSRAFAECLLALNMIKQNRGGRAGKKADTRELSGATEERCQQKTHLKGVLNAILVGLLARRRKVCDGFGVILEDEEAVGGRDDRQLVPCVRPKDILREGVE